jgi:hypothetical protein
MFGEQAELLSRAALSYDQGHHVEALNMAARLRTLCHDGEGRSLLRQLRLTDTWFVDSCVPIEPVEHYKGSGIYTTTFNLMGTGLAGIESLGEGKAGWFAPFAEDDRTLASVRFKDWWSGRAVLRDDRRSWTRKQLVLELANREGGVHIDPAQNERYERLATKVARCHIADDDGPLEMVGNPVGATVRQMSWELTQTLPDLQQRLQAA